jgi:methylenetetrahydrofolate dehydrogenase (NADP+)/methenyltetrahydrofolate cyclohydrolase
MSIIDVRTLSNNIRADLKTKAAKFLAHNGRPCALAVVLVGNDPASEIYVKNKQRACEGIGVKSTIYKMDEKTSENEILRVIDKLNKDETVDGILVQLPLPNHIDGAAVLERIAPAKDVDGLTTQNVGRLSQGRECVMPCTALGVLKILKSLDVDLTGMHAVVVGRSNLVGKPVAQLLLAADCTVTIAHSKTKDLGALTRTADILVVATGVKHLIKRDMVKRGAIVIDVGITRGADGKTYGDVDFENVQSVAGYITTVPGGVGLMTIAMLLNNLLGE